MAFDSFTPLNEGTVLRAMYSIRSLLGKGGMGAVYLAENLLSSENVALKQTFYGDHSELRDAFHREAKLLARLKHPALPRVTDYFADEGSQFLVMELIEGEDLASCFDKHGHGEPMELKATLLIAQQLFEALEYLHAKDIIHRDLKPANLKVTPDGQLKVLDFGAAKGSLGETTIYSVPVATPGYAPPEQIYNLGTSELTDVFSAAATLYHLLAGQPPPSAARRDSQIRAGQMDPLQPLNQLNGNVPLGVSDLIVKAMSLAPQDRFTATRILALLANVDADTYVNRGMAYKNEGDLDQAIKDFTKALELGPTDTALARILFQRGHTYFEKGDYDKAFKDFDQAIELDDFTIRALPTEYNVKDHNKAIEVNPDDADAYVRRGAVYDLLGDDEKAIVDYRTALQIDPKHKDAKHQLEKIIKKLQSEQKTDDELVRNLREELAEIKAEQGIGDEALRAARIRQLKDEEEELGKAIADLKAQISAMPNDNELPVESGTSVAETHTDKWRLLVPYRTGNLWGFCDADKNIVIPPKFGYAFPFSEGLAMVEMNYGKYGFINERAEEVIPIKYEGYALYTSEFWGSGFCTAFKDGRARMKLDGKYVLVDLKGKELLLPDYTHVGSFNDGLALVRGSNGKRGYINTDGTETIRTTYSFACDFSEGKAGVVVNGKYGFINTDGEIIIPPKYSCESMSSDAGFSEGRAWVGLEKFSKYGFIDKTGNVVIPLKYRGRGLDSYHNFHNGLAVVSVGEKYGFIDRSGNEVIPLAYGFAWGFNEGFARVQLNLNEKWSVIDTQGNIVFDPPYARVYPFSDGLACVSSPAGHKYSLGYIDTRGNEVIPLKYDGYHEYADYGFRNGLARIHKPTGTGTYDFKYGYIGQNGTEYFED